MLDRTPIENTIYRYAVGFDENDIAMMANCFTADGEIVTPMGNLSGREAIREVFQGRRDLRTQAKEQTRHVVSNVTIEEVSNDEVRASSYYTLMVTGAGTTTAAGTGRYIADLVRDGATWLIQRRQLLPDG